MKYWDQTHVELAKSQVENVTMKLPKVCEGLDN
jgi:hypothetical protein